MLKGLRFKPQSELQVTTFVGNEEFLKSITQDKIGFLRIDLEVHAMTQGRQVRAKKPLQPVPFPVIKKKLTTSQTRSLAPGDSFQSLNRSGQNTEQYVIDLTHEGLNTSVSVEKRDLLEGILMMYNSVTHDDL